MVELCPGQGGLRGARGGMPSSEPMFWAWGGGTDVLRGNEEEEAPARQSWGRQKGARGSLEGGFLASPLPSLPRVFPSLGAERALGTHSAAPHRPEGPSAPWRLCTGLGGAAGGRGPYGAAEVVL